MSDNVDTYSKNLNYGSWKQTKKIIWKKKKSQGPALTSVVFFCNGVEFVLHGTKGKHLHGK